MKSNWRVYTKKADFKAIGERFGIDQVMARIIRNRGLETYEQINMYLNGTVDDMHSPHLLKDADKCVDILTDKIHAGKKIHIIGDYDIDGICSTTILYKGLKAAGADVTFAVPDRIIDGYGINEHLIDEAYNNGTDTIITCDNGIAAIEQIKYAKEKGMTVIVTDHHDIPFDFVDGEKIHKVPHADAIVNPKQEDCQYPFDKLCGAGVAFKVIKILYEKCGLNPAGLEEYAELMAIATIGDVVDLSDENRVIVKYGLKHLSVTTNIGIRALVEACELEIDKISSYHIGFVIGPCLNATGRLDSARRAIELLLTTDMEDARKKALELRTLNVERKDITEEYAAIAIEQVENTELKDDKVLVVYLPDCHESVAGIIAGRVREKFYRPSIVITKAEDGAKGSGRSIEGYNMFEEISKCGKLLNKYGGHPMAAGISLDIDKIDEFRKALNENQTMTENVLTPTVWIDVPMPVDYVDIKLIKQFEKLQPFGKGNEKPVFADRNLTVRQSAVIGKNKNVLKCQLESEHGKLVTAIRFKLDGQEIPEVGKKISMVYYPDINEYNGIVSIQFRIEDWRYV
ncbi:single-stranded-DNA-specific exonuclease RecJ [Lachnospira eligens]|uniref:single-stranded-DNA-specific exonuclease RecJ n=1 Tax=Lachnospira eligens TaxID=39485 RepID=UPI00189911E7